MNKSSLRMLKITRQGAEGEETQTILAPVRLPDDEPRNRAERRRYEAIAKKELKRAMKAAKYKALRNNELESE